MVTSIARQSVIIKCNMQKSVIVGNYEFYYAAGLMNRLFHLECQAQMKPEELLAYILSREEQIHPSNEKEEYLVKLVKYYEPLEKYDEQMVELFHWGENEKDVWQIKTSYTS